VRQGLRNKEIAGRLAVSEYTVKKHLNNIFRKFRITRRIKLIALARE
jgi:DNA-binding NarL/FixJ family response regulator